VKRVEGIDIFLTFLFLIVDSNCLTRESGPFVNEIKISTLLAESEQIN
jgi:hypothetical protein